MKVIPLVISVLRPARFLIVVFTCAVLLLSNTFPAFAIDSYQSDPREGTTQLLEIQRKTDEIAKSAPPNLEKVQKESNKGLNEVQGDADIDQQKRPSNSQSSTSVEDNVKTFLDKVTGK
ncbi:low temperature-induced protein [Calothrix sp. PCC 7507]|uniref:low temperature-induced protein n=1 Tax=Calothrix sp. PCC 7507 TaxID=99598 RepID=UPI00029EEAC1|nr:low temperature-induced protein [Calothrix sp. PCC 7507]AFY34738.1 low temperature-induced protein [Calothrix sp. PCC 7507]